MPVAPMPASAPAMRPRAANSASSAPRSWRFAGTQGAQDGQPFSRSSWVAWSAEDQHHHPGHHRKAEHELHRADQLLDHALDLADHRRHVDHREVGKAATSRLANSICAGGQVEAGDVAGRLAIQHAGAAITKKLTRIESQSSLRRLVMRASLRTPAISKVRTSPSASPEGLGEALLDGELGRGVGPVPAPRHHAVAVRQAGVEGEVEVAVHQAPGAVVGVVVGAHRAVVHRHQPAADHRLQQRRRAAVVGKEARAAVPAGRAGC